MTHAETKAKTMDEAGQAAENERGKMKLHIRIIIEG